MPIPRFLSPAPIEIDPRTAPGTLTLGGAGPARSRNTGFRIERQEQDNWCWSAVGVSVERFYDAVGTRTQCALANTALGRGDCCTDGRSDPAKCDQPWYLDRVLGLTGNLEDMKDGPVPFATLRARLDRGVVVCCRIGWFGGGGHFAVITGWRVAGNGRTYIDIADPIWMETQVALDAFPASYHSGGDWTHSYLTCPAAVGGAMALAHVDDPDRLGA